MSEALFLNNGDLETSRQVKIKVKFPTQPHPDKPNDVAFYFKHFDTVLLAAHPCIFILNWDKPKQNPVRKTIYISPSEDTIKQYFSGIMVQAIMGKIKGFVNIQSCIPFSIIKQNNRIWSWLTKNRVFVRITILSQSYHVTI